MLGDRGFQMLKRRLKVSKGNRETSIFERSKTLKEGDSDIFKRSLSKGGNQNEEDEMMNGWNWGQGGRDTIHRYINNNNNNNKS